VVTAEQGGGAEEELGFGDFENSTKILGVASMNATSHNKLI
jgi:hypothetical protein